MLLILAESDVTDFGQVVLADFSFGVLVGCFVFNGPLRQYFSVYRAVSQRERERERERERGERKAR